MTAVDFDGRRPVVEGQDHAERAAGRARSDRDRRGAQGASGAPLTDTDRRLISEAAFVIADAIALLRVSRHRIPLRWLRLLDALNRCLSAGGHRERVDLSALKTTKQLAAEWGCDARTVRRKAETAGGRKVNGWIFPEDT
ncbi:hypothetical protein Mycch_4769 [Mycolicibacterium chubuense NBB4]|uniref:Uncharacterized protein n=1 Tax=Mycolicibacterium chubuense (strain NBB4) TaxID=710421 RepID=I4BQB0_MYCCN|nr:hypothetical protein [Mycolicibacterium chubuense]AFM19467.1 hypothetical protein Mycch_4769 [Mycolicibacterium chubuense NBB4]